MTCKSDKEPDNQLVVEIELKQYFEKAADINNFQAFIFLDFHRSSEAPDLLEKLHHLHYLHYEWHVYIRKTAASEAHIKKGWQDEANL